MKTIIITGPSSSGKTILANKLSRLFDNSILVKTDSYYRDNIFIRVLSIMIFDIYDRPQSIKINNLKRTIKSIYRKDTNVLCSYYDFKKKSSSKSNVCINYKGKNQFLILEGIFSHCLDLNYQNTINILCKEEKKICLNRRLIRDNLERGRDNREVNLRFNRSWELFYKNIKGFVNRNRVITINTADKNCFDKLFITLQNIKKT